MRYINNENPNIRILVKRGPEIPKGENPNSRIDKWVEFHFGRCETEDPDAMAILEARPDCIREEDYDKRDGYVRQQDVNFEVERLVKERLAALGVSEEALASSADAPAKKVMEIKVCPEPGCKKECKGRLALHAHMKTHKKVAVGASG